MVAELEKITYDDSGGFRAEYISEPTGSGIFILNMRLYLTPKATEHELSETVLRSSIIMILCLLVVIFRIAGTITGMVLHAPEEPGAFCFILSYHHLVKHCCHSTNFILLKSCLLIRKGELHFLSMMQKS